LDQIDRLMMELGELKRRVSETEMFTGAEIADALATLQALVDGLLTQINGIFSGYVQAGGNITSTGGRGTFASGLSSVGASATDLSALAGLRQTVWQLYTGGNAGLYGYASSSFRTKTHWKKADFTAAQFLACFPYVYEYRGQVSIRDDKRNPNYDPNYQVPLDIGYLAELLIRNGLGIFVTMKDTVPIGIDYAAFASAGMTIIGREMDARLTSIESRLDAGGL
jgi:hypothetical protein